jgi:hypothetical protein
MFSFRLNKAIDLTVFIKKENTFEHVFKNWFEYYST